MWQKIRDFFKGVLREIAAFLNPLALEIARSGGKLLIEAAAAAVLAAEQSGGTGEEKLKLARDIVIDKLRMAGIPIVLNAIHGAIEAAVAEYNQKPY